MKVIENLSELPYIAQPSVFTIGNFDGVHLGHQHLIQYVNKIATKKGTSIIGTFKNHPSETLKNKKKLFSVIWI